MNMAEYDRLMQEEYDYEDYCEDRHAAEERPLPIEQWRLAAGDWWKLR